MRVFKCAWRSAYSGYLVFNACVQMTSPEVQTLRTEISISLFLNTVGSEISASFPY